MGHETRWPPCRPPRTSTTSRHGAGSWNSGNLEIWKSGKLTITPEFQIPSFPLGCSGPAPPRDMGPMTPAALVRTPPTPARHAWPPEEPAAPLARLGHQHRNGATQRANCNAREVRSVAFQQRSVEITFIIDADRLRAIGISIEAESAGRGLLRSLVATRHSPCFDLLLI